jgi:hypothetical protein
VRISKKRAAAMLTPVLILLAAATMVRAARQTAEGPQPWAPGRCYRVTIIYPEQQHTLRVVESPRGDWVRVHTDPLSPSVPGASTRRPIWLNTASVFTLQEVECATWLRE